MSCTAKDIESTVVKLKKAIPCIKGWSNKIRNGKLRLYVQEAPATAQTVEAVKICGQTFSVEYVVIGTPRALGSAEAGL